jgi:hypothetical protein
VSVPPKLNPMPGFPHELATAVVQTSAFPVSSVSHAMVYSAVVPLGHALAPRRIRQNEPARSLRPRLPSSTLAPLA